MDSSDVDFETQTPTKTILVAANSTWNIVNFRMPILRALKNQGFRVVAAAPPDERAEDLAEIGIEVEPLHVDPHGLSPLADLRLILAYRTIMKRVQPHAFLPFTPKPNIYGSIAAAAESIPVVNTITGLGTGFLTGKVLRLIVTSLYRFGLRRSYRVFFHNDDDRDLFLRLRIVSGRQAAVVAGSGVDVEKFIPLSNRAASRCSTFLFIGRLLRDKGAVEFAEAARIVKPQRQTRFQILGSPELHPKAVPAAMISSWKHAGIIELLDTVEDVRPIIAQADCIVLPSYREGLPRVLLEAGAMAKPVIATDVPGCRQVVEHESTGLLCEPRCSLSLAQAMLLMIDLPPEERFAMGRRGRQRIERNYSEDRVISDYLDTLIEVGVHSRPDVQSGSQSTRT